MRGFFVKRGWIFWEGIIGWCFDDGLNVTPRWFLCSNWLMSLPLTGGVSDVLGHLGDEGRRFMRRREAYYLALEILVNWLPVLRWLVEILPEFGKTD